VILALRVRAARSTGTTPDMPKEATMPELFRLRSYDLLIAASHYASKEETRYYLNGVCVQPAGIGGAYIVATDGHCMFVGHDPQATCTRSVIVPTNALKFGKEWSACSDAKYRSVTYDGQALSLMGEGEQPHTYDMMHAPEVDGSFPDWTRIVPKPAAAHIKKDADPHRGPVFNSMLMDRARKAAKALGHKERESAGCVAYDCGAGNLMLVRFTARADAYGVMMPLRNDYSECRIPFEARAHVPEAIAAE
jgi:hypothetical protein